MALIPSQPKYRQFRTAMVGKLPQCNSREKIFSRWDFFVFSHRFLMENVVSTLPNFPWEDASVAI